MSEEHTPDYSVIPSTGAKGDAWPSGLNLTQGIKGSFSQAGWKDGSEGFIQQTFLGASIRSFDVSAGFGDSSSNLTVGLVEDEYNKSDEAGLGVGDDVYHDGKSDKFVPPPVGSPVFFKFGKNFATVDQAWRRTIDETYGIETLEQIEFDTVEQSGVFIQIPSGEDNMPEYKDRFYLKSEDKQGEDTETDDIRVFVNKKELYEYDNKDRGSSHFCFGGVLQSVIENRGPNGNPLYTVQVTDPREILSNCSLILNDYAGTTFNNKNLFNIYGFLEYDPSDALQNRLDTESLYKWVLEKRVDDKGLVSYVGVDENLPDPSEISYFVNGSFKTTRVNPSTVNYDLYKFSNPLTEGAVGKVFAGSKFPKLFPITGEGFSRRSEQGIPWYRVSQALAALFEQYGELPQEYKDAGFGGQIDFRGFNYIVDFGGLPLHRIPKTYFLDFNQIDLLSLVLELCDVISHDLFVSLMPVVDPLTSPQEEEDEKAAIMNMAFAKNSYHLKRGETNKIIHGIIRLDAIDRSQQPSYGSIQRYINKLEESDIHVENRDLGFELSNVTTDKFVAGAQEVEMYYFSTHKDRDNLEYRKKINGISNNSQYISENQWTLGASLRQQVLPFYGFLGKKALSIPRGFGSYQQIMLDTQGLEAYGVGNYYITTELELRAAAVSFENWVKFLESYNEIYIEEIGEYQAFYKSLAAKNSADIEGLGNAPAGFNITDLENREFGVSVPRCVFSSDKNFMGPDGYPASPCAPPYGYPLYYKRAQKIGLPKYGVGKLQNAVTNIIHKLEEIKEFAKSDPETNFLMLELERLENSYEIGRKRLPMSYGYIDYEAETAYRNANACLTEKIGEVQDSIEQLEEQEQYVPMIENFIEQNQKRIQTLNKMSRRGLDNAKKVYTFLKKVADDNLGKKFLVKIPKYCNINYAEQIVLKKHYGYDDQKNVIDLTHTVKEIQNGPFGFRPIPVNESGINFLETQQFEFEMNKIRQTEVFPPPPWNYEKFLYKEPLQQTYSYGALKGNYNPISEKWAFNYKPESQGGFFNFGLYSRNLSLSTIEQAGIKGKNLPYVTQYQLAPKDLTNFVNEKGRISCYVRFDNSQYLDLNGIPAESLTQELVTSKGNIPDIMEDLDNVNLEQRNAFDRVKDRLSSPENVQNSVAFVKCTVDEELYMPPKTVQSKNLVYGRAIRFIPNVTQMDIIETTDEDGCPDFQCFQPYAEPIFAPTDDYQTAGAYVGEIFLPPNKYGVIEEYGKPFRVIKGGGADGTLVTIEDHAKRYKKDLDVFVVDTEEKNLDSDHVYALITLPARIKTTADQRFMDSVFQSSNTTSIKHQLTQDVVRGAPGFEEPAPIVNEKLGIDCSQFSFEELEDAMKAQRNAVEQIHFGHPNLTYAFNQPSPIFPNLVALPLLSTERCYGPWLSFAKLDDSKNRYRDIGGKIEFVKDENLAPWNFAGYQLMDEAGRLQAEFSNSLLLFSERGGFSFPAEPSGISIGKQLESAGPLVTSLNVSVSDAGFKTTVKMDLYTSRFGKLQKQKEQAIAQITRERQRIIDQNNEMIRKGFIKSASSKNIFGDFSAQNQVFDTLASNLEKGVSPITQSVLSVVSNPRRGSNIATGDEIITNERSIVGSYQPQEVLNESIAIVESWSEGFKKWYNSAAKNVTDDSVPVSQEPGHTEMPTPDYSDIQQKMNLVVRDSLQ